MTYTPVRVLGTQGKSAVYQLLVDTGPVFTWIDKNALAELGIQPKGNKKFRTIEGREITRQYGETTLEIEGESATRIVVFGEEGDASVLGADSLEGLGFEVDATSKKLKKLEAFAAYKV